ncbi:hypothetical protein C8R43DRAFT_1114134 [Mycena crocata]|nr:hypothetical protein C8R43DRAFT_1114134 [Mycena crocata]
MPNTACIMYRKTNAGPKNLLLAPPVDQSQTHTTQSTPPPMRTQTAVYPNLSGPMKDLGLLLQKRNIDGLALGLKFHQTMSPLQMRWFQSQLGHCSEILGWLYLLDPDMIFTCFLSGIASGIEHLRTMKNFERHSMTKALKPACLNCCYVVRMVNAAMEAKRLASSGPSSTSFNPRFQYNDRVGSTALIPNPQQAKCYRLGCENSSDSNQKCGFCWVVWYCSSECGTADWKSYHRKKLSLPVPSQDSTRLPDSSEEGQTGDSPDTNWQAAKAWDIQS